MLINKKKLRSKFLRKRNLKRKRFKKANHYQLFLQILNKERKKFYRKKILKKKELYLLILLRKPLLTMKQVIMGLKKMQDQVTKTVQVAIKNQVIINIKYNKKYKDSNH